MRNGSNELNTVAQLNQKFAEARDILHAARIDNTSRLSLREAALAASVEPDELLAQLEYRARHATRLTPKVEREVVEYV